MNALEKKAFLKVSPVPFGPVPMLAAPFQTSRPAERVPRAQRAKASEARGARARSAREKMPPERFTWNLGRLDKISEAESTARVSAEAVTQFRACPRG